MWVSREGAVPALPVLGMHTQGDPPESLTRRSHTHMGSGPAPSAVFVGAVNPRPFGSWCRAGSGFCLDPLARRCAVYEARQGLA